MSPGTPTRHLVFATAVLLALVTPALGGCVSDATHAASGTSGSDASAGGVGKGSGGDGSAAGGGDGGPSGAIPIVAGGSPDVPYQFGPNAFGIQGGAFFTKSNYGATTVVLDKTQVGKVCLSGTVDMVPTPADGSEPPYSSYWGIEVGFNLNQGGDAGSAEGGAAAKTPWLVPSGVVGFWFTVEGSSIPDIRFKTTPTGKDPALEQDSCALVSPSSGVPNPVPFAQFFVQCWDGPQGTAPTDISQGLEDVGLQIAADTLAPHPLDFCWTGFGVITQ